MKLTQVSKRSEKLHKVGGVACTRPYLCDESAGDGLAGLQRAHHVESEGTTAETKSLCASADAADDQNCCQAERKAKHSHHLPKASRGCRVDTFGDDAERRRAAWVEDQVFERNEEAT